MPRALVLVSAVALAGIAGVVSLPVQSYARMRQAEQLVAEALVSLHSAQRAFRSHGGNGRYATTVESLTTSCRAGQPAALAASVVGGIEQARYTLVLRNALRGVVAGNDCHGRPTTTDFYAAAQPREPFAGRQAASITSWGRVYVFFDGIAPLEADMGAGGLAVPFDRLNVFKIP